MDEKGAKKAELVQILMPMERIAGHWNAVVEGLEGVKKSWDQMQELLLTTSREEVELAPMELQKAVTRFRRAKFEAMLGRFVTHYKAFGGLEAMKVKKGGAK
jgi:hypothetical protein